MILRVVDREQPVRLDIFKVLYVLPANWQAGYPLLDVVSLNEIPLHSLLSVSWTILECSILNLIQVSPRVKEGIDLGGDSAIILGFRYLLAKFKLNSADSQVLVEHLSLFKVKELVVSQLLKHSILVFKVQYNFSGNLRLERASILSMGFSQY